MVQQKECSISLVQLWAAPLNCITLEPGLGGRCRVECSCFEGALSSKGEQEKEQEKDRGKDKSRGKNRSRGKGSGKRIRGKISGVILKFNIIKSRAGS